MMLEECDKLKQESPFSKPEKDRIHRVSSTDCLRIQYEIRYGYRVLEATGKDETVEYQMNEGLWPDQIESQMLGKPLGSEFEIKVLSSDYAFGMIDRSRVLMLAVKGFEQLPEPGALVQFTLADGQQSEGQVLRVMDDQVEVDFNHPYAGRDLNIKIQVIAVVD